MLCRHGSRLWRGAGVAVPVFALRSRRSVGVGEFLDIKLLVDICHASGPPHLRSGACTPHHAPPTQPSSPSWDTNDQGMAPQLG